MPPELDEETKASMTPDEIAAYESEEDDTTTLADEVVDDGKAKDSPFADEPDEEEEDDPEDPLADPDAEDDPEPAPAKVDPPAAPADDDPAMPTPPALTFTKADEDRIKAIETEIKELVAAADDGEESFSVASEKVAALTKEAARLEVKKERDTEATEAFQTKGEEIWTNACVAWFTAQGIDPEKFAANPKLEETFDAIVRDVTGGAIGRGLTPKQQLDEALAIYQRRPGAEEWPGKGLTPAKGGKASRRERSVVLPPSLNDIAPAGGGGVEDGRYSALDTLAETNPLKFEAALEKMSEEQRDAYMASR